MTSLLHLDSSASPRHHSVSRRLTERYAETWRAAHQQGSYLYRDLAADPVPLISAAYCELGKRVERQGIVPLPKVEAMVESVDEEREWAATLPLITELRAARTVLLGVPMYNFAVPAALKAWIDRITFPGAFTDPDTGESVLGGTRVVVVTARGGAYGQGTPREPFDFQMPYLRAYFENLGVPPTGLTFIHAESTRAADVPALNRYQDFAAASLEAARTAVTARAAEPHP